MQPPILTEEFDQEKAEPSLTVEGDVVLKVIFKGNIARGTTDPGY